MHLITTTNGQPTTLNICNNLTDDMIKKLSDTQNSGIAPVYAISHHKNGVMELTIFEGGFACTATLSADQTAQLVQLLTGGGNQPSCYALEEKSC